MFKDAPFLESQLYLPLIHRGKVRDVYELDDKTLLMVASDRVSAFDVVLPQPYNEDEGSLLEYQYRMANIRKKGVRTNLMALAKGYKIDHDYDSLHNAIVDLELNLKVWNKLKWEIEV